MTQKRPQHAGIADALRVIWQAIKGFVDNVIYLVMFNVLWCVSLPFLITVAPSTAALYVLCLKLANDEEVYWRDFFFEFYQWFFAGWRWGVVSLIAWGLIVVNALFYLSLDSFIRTPMSVLWGFLAAFWFMLQMYSFPVLLHQEERNVRRSVRNAFALVLRHPLFTLVFALSTIFLIFLGLMFPILWLIFAGAFVANLYVYGVRFLVRLETGNASSPDES